MLHYIKTNKINNEQDAIDVFVVVERVVDFFSLGAVGVRAVDAGGDIEKVMILLLFVAFDKCGKKTYYYCS